MPKFFYRAKTNEGKIIEESKEAKDKFSLVRDLKSRGLTPLSLKENSLGLGGVTSVDGIFQKIFGKVKMQEQIIFTKNLSGMLKAGLSLSRAISVLKKQTKNPKFENILNVLDEEINAGGTLSSGLAKFPNIFSKLFVSMIKAGEESGNLADALSEVGTNLEKAHNLTKKVKGALMYPSIILSAMILIGMVMFAYVVPTLAKTFKDTGAKIPASTKFIIGLGEFFSNYLIFAILGTILIGVGLYFLSRAKFLAKYIDFIILKLPAVGKMSQELNTARTARTISSLLVSGVPITRAIEITEDVVQNIYYRKILEKTRDVTEKGSPMSEIFIANPKLYPVMMSEMVQVGEETGKLSDMLLQIALFYEDEVENKTKNLSTIIEPVLMVIIGSAVGFFAVSMLSPMYSVMNGIK